MKNTPQEKTLCDGSQYSTPNRRGRRISRTPPRSDLPLFKRFVFSDDAAHFYPSAVALASKLLKRGQDPENIAHDMERMARHAGLSDFVAPVVNELAMRGAA